VILMTGYGSNEVREKAIALGVVKYFVKPVQVSELIELLTQLGLPIGRT
jgi:YesN/AraC family two-component response regulator